MKTLITIIAASIGLHTSNEIVMLTCVLIAGFVMYNEFKTKK